MDIPEVAFVVLVRLPLKSIARFRSVCKEWRDLIDSDFFRDHFISRNSSSSISWSIIQMHPHKLTLEIVGHHGCKTWGLARSPGSFMSFFVERAINKIQVLACTDGLVLVYLEAADDTAMYYVGNPLFQEWFRVPLPPFLSLEDLEILRLYERFSDTGLVTKMQSGIVVSYKVVLLMNQGGTKVSFAIYSSDTGKWENRNVSCPRYHWWFRFGHRKPIALNGMLHWFSNLKVFFMAYDFYGGNVDDGCRIISFPDSGKDDVLRRFRRTFTTSEGSIVYFNEYLENENRTLRVWRLVKYTDGPEAWQLLWEVSLVSMIQLLGIDYFPVVMHPLNSEIIYFWSRNKKGMVLFNLRTLALSLHKENEDDSKCMDGCVLSFNRCSEYMENICGYFFPWFNSCCPNHLIFSQYVLPCWLHRLPRPPPT